MKQLDVFDGYHMFLLKREKSLNQTKVVLLKMSFKTIRTSTSNIYKRSKLSKETCEVSPFCLFIGGGK